MTADEMFEELGYKMAEDNKRIKYKKDDDNIYYFYKDLKEYRKIFGNITMNELKAMDKKCKELGWLE